MESVSLEGKSGNLCVHLLNQSRIIIVARFVGRGCICSFVLHCIYFLLASFDVSQELWRPNKFYLGQFNNFIEGFLLCFLILKL